MPIDPRAPWPTDPTAQLYARVADLTRRLDANPGAQSAGGADPSVLTIVNSTTFDYGGPYADVRVPEGGAFVELYLEAEGRLISGNGDLRGQVARFDAGPAYAPRGSLLQWSGAGVGSNPFALLRQNGISAGPGVQSGNSLNLAGVVMRYWELPGVYRFGVMWVASGVTGEVQNRRLMVRVAP